MTRPLLSVSVLASLIALTACDGLKNAPAAGADGGSGDDGGVTQGGSSPLSPSEGPGSHGSLPTGYCCTQDAECRDRHCVAVGSGNRMCLDACYSQSKCNRPDRIGAFTCDAPMGDEGLCQPGPAALTCVPQNKFVRGTRQVGSCCEATFDGRAGDECEGNQCVAVNEKDQDNPFVCSHWCDSTKDCPAPTICSPFHACVPANRPYTCN